MYGQTRWWALGALALVYIGIVFNAYWTWGVLMVIWVFQDMRRGNTHLLETVTRRSNPWTFWGIEITWILTASFFILKDLGWLPEFLMMGK